MKNRVSPAAFTLIELLVVITIIGILASIALPAFQSAQKSAQQTKALSNARQIVIALRSYASDNDGSFPMYQVTAGAQQTTTITSSNMAFRALFPQYLVAEQIFYTPGSAWTPKAPDDRIDQVTDTTGTQTLKSGENTWAYVYGLTDSSNAALPLVADGFTAAANSIIANPVYSATQTAKGGVWQAKTALVCHVDQSAAKMTVNTQLLYPTKTSQAGATVNYFAPDSTDPNWLQPTTQGPMDPE